jgi:type IV pilus assembly protein PilW
MSMKMIRRASGFSMIEILVGMAIAMAGVVIMMQVFTLSEGQKRTTTGSSDAQNAGAIALYSIQRDIRMAGWGISDFKIIGCDVLLRSGLVLGSMAPVTINHSSIPVGSATTQGNGHMIGDSILIISGSLNASPEGDGITGFTSSGGPTYAVQTPNAYSVGDKVIAIAQSRPSPCSGANQLTLDTVASINVPSATVTVTTGATGMSGGTLYNLGGTVRVTVYAVRNQSIGTNLTQCDYIANDCSDATKINDTTVWVPIGSNVVTMRAQYGRDTDTPMDGIVNANGWDQVTPTSNSNCGWVKVRAVRFALVSGSSQYEKADASNFNTLPTTNAPTWEGSSATGSSSGTGAAAPIVLTDNSDWQHYRYKVFQAVVPIKNVAWPGPQSAC